MFGTIQNITIHSPSSTSPSITSQCVFVQYEERQSAQLAIDQMNDQPLWNQQKSNMSSGSDGGGDSRRIKLEVNWVFMDGPLENHYTRYCSSSRHRRDRNREQSRRHVYLDHHQQNRERSASSSYNRTQDDSHRRSHHQKRHRKNNEDDVTTTTNDKKKQKIHNDDDHELEKHDMQTETIADTATTTIERTKDDHIDSNVANDSRDNNHCLKQQPTDSDNIERSNEE